MHPDASSPASPQPLKSKDDLYLIAMVDRFSYPCDKDCAIRFEITYGPLKLIDVLSPVGSPVLEMTKARRHDLLWTDQKFELHHAVFSLTADKAGSVYSTSGQLQKGSPTRISFKDIGLDIHYLVSYRRPPPIAGKYTAILTIQLGPYDDLPDKDSE